MANRILVYENGQRVGVSGTVQGQLPTWNAATSAWEPVLPQVFAGEYFVSTTGNDTTGNGSLSQPFKTIQKAVTVAKSAYADGVPVAINIAAGSYADALTLDRYNTYLRGAGCRAEENRATQITVPITVNCVSATDVYGRQVGIEGCYVSSGSDAPAVSVTGTGYFSIVITNCYLTTGNAGSSANAFACSNVNARSVVTDSIVSVGSSSATAAIVNLTGGSHLWGNTRVQHGSTVTAAATSKALVVGGTAYLFADRLLIEPRTNGYQISVTGTWPVTTAPKLTLTNSSLTSSNALATTAAGITSDIAAPNFAMFLWNVAFYVPSASNVVQSATSAVVSYAQLTYLSGSGTTLSGITAVPATVRTGTTQADALALPNGTASRFLYTDAAKAVTALGSGTKALAGYNASGSPDVITLGSGLSMTGSVLSATGGGGGGSGTVTQVDTGTGLTGGPITTSGMISVDFGTSSGKVAQGNDNRFPPAPSSVGQVLYDTGTAWTALAAGSEGKVLTAHGAAAPTWEPAAAGGVTQVSTGTGLTGGPITTSGTISLAALDPAPTGSYGSESAVPAITVDAYGRVTGVVSMNIELAASAITSGTLAVERGGTGTGTAPTVKGVIYADSASAYASTAAGTTGTVLRGVTDAAPAFGQVDLTTDVTGTLPANNQASQTLGGDLSGTTATATVTKLQNRAVSAAAPTAGQVLAWNGSEYVSVPMPAGGSSGGGVTYFFDQASAASGTNLPASTYVLGRSAQAAYSSKTASSISTGGWDRVAGFVTDAGDPNISTLPVGLWDFNVWATTAAALGTVRARLTLYAYDNATDPESGVAIATSGEMELYDQGGSAQYATSLIVPSGVSLAGNQRLYLKLEVRASISGQSVEFGFGDASPTHTHTTVPSVTGTGIVKVLNSVIVSTGQQVSLTSEVSGTLPVGNGGTGTGTAPTVKGVIYAASASAYASTAAGTTGTVLRGVTDAAPAFGQVALGTDVSGTLPIANGGTGASTAANARTNLGAAASGANSDITSLTGTFTAGLTVSRGGTGRQTLTANSVLVGNVANAVTLVAPGATGTVLMANASGAPSFNSLPYDVSGEVGGTPTENTVIFHFKAVRAFTFKGTGSVAGCVTQPSGPTSLTITKIISGVSTTIGSIDYTSANTTGTVNITSSLDHAIGVGDQITVTTPAAVNALDGPFWTFFGVCP